MKYMDLNPEIVEYVERNIIPIYDGFDKAHRRDHVRTVIEQSMKLAAHEPRLDPDMVYIIAAFHDLGLQNGRENHHTDSRKILESDRFIRKNFTSDQIGLMGEAVEDHRASNRSRPRSIYGLIVAEADRQIDAETIVRRTIQYGLSHYPNLDREGHIRRATEHLYDKYGPEGYLKIWIPWSDNAANLKRLHAVMADCSRLNRLIERIYGEETAPDPTQES